MHQCTRGQGYKPKCLVHKAENETEAQTGGYLYV